MRQPQIYTCSLWVLRICTRVILCSQRCSAKQNQVHTLTGSRLRHHLMHQAYVLQVIWAFLCYSTLVCDCIITNAPMPPCVTAMLTFHSKKKKQALWWRNAPPLPVSVFSAASHWAPVLVAASVKGVPQELPGLWSGSWMVNRQHIFPCQPRLVTLWLVFLYKHIHGNLHHVFAARALWQRREQEGLGSDKCSIRQWHNSILICLQDLLNQG